MKNQIDVNAAAAETILRRLPLIWWQMFFPTSDGQAEMRRMVMEKQAALVNGMIAAQSQMMRETLRFWTMPFSMSRTGKASERILDAATAPARRTVKANVKRLRKG